MRPKDDQKPKVKRKLHWDRRSGKWLVIDANRPAWAIVNESGREIINLCTGRKDVKQISQLMSEKYGCGTRQIKKDVKDFLQQMQKAGIVYFSRTASRKPKTFIKVKIRELVLEITNKCNYRCVQCYVAGGDGRTDFLPLEEIKTLITNFIDRDGKEIAISGGEPLLHPDFKEIVDFAVDKKVQLVKVLSNGSLIDDAMADFLARENIMVQVSLDGATPETNDLMRGKGNFERSMRGAERMIERGRGTHLVFSMTPTRLNYKEAPMLIELAAAKGVKNVHFSKLTKLGRAHDQWNDMQIPKEDLITYHESLAAAKSKYGKEIRINAMFGQGWVDRMSAMTPPMVGCNLGDGPRVRADGKIFPCPRFDHDEFCVGTIDDPDLNKISKNIMEISSVFIDRMEEATECSVCLYKYFCGGGCIADAYLHSGSIRNADSSCDIRQMFYNYSIDCSMDRKKEAARHV